MHYAILFEMIGFRSFSNLSLFTYSYGSVDCPEKEKLLDDYFDPSRSRATSEQAVLRNV